MPPTPASRSGEATCGPRCGYASGSCCRPPRFGVGDVSRAHIAQNLTRGLDRRHVPTGWPIPELFFVLVSDPSGLLAALIGNLGEHAVPPIFLDLVITGG